MSQPKIEIYSSNDCSYCEKAKKLLEKSDIKFTLLNLSEDDSLLDELKQRIPGAKTLPQIFIDGLSIGSYEDLLALVENKSIYKSQKD